MKRMLSVLVVMALLIMRWPRLPLPMSCCCNHPGLPPLREKMTQQRSSTVTLPF